MLALGELHEFLFALHVWKARLLAPKRVRRHEAIGANVPAAGMRVFGIGEDGNPGRLAVDRAGIIAPRGDVTPTFLLAGLAVGVRDLAVALFLADGVVDAHAEGAFFGVGEGKRADAS